ncbi:hypothetical protein GUITHDRAFT_107193 [Guillardia theta CCMP2712]|uniref:Uncharacterized protein n=1 Tax=Guillardia theta (strain CCMP2712) TaxID=905079 RepID=L1JEX6_GUITC|nr:hypothetical protein GUITHDRAFT_107193 [Guillardia theta CCMP2712]EKX46837.1 hypothetical protein GUITHDRAFT_107193 [Guillardia theta CCMP2712]|eukprot:XP_005833817.1 hypothetical protein GUITHDRAFT_107193 [Guillardia theta CCMP2712]
MCWQADAQDLRGSSATGEMIDLRESLKKRREARANLPDNPKSKEEESLENGDKELSSEGPETQEENGDVDVSVDIGYDLREVLQRKRDGQKLESKQTDQSVQRTDNLRIHSVDNKRYVRRDDSNLPTSAFQDEAAEGDARGDKSFETARDQIPESDARNTELSADYQASVRRDRSPVADVAHGSSDGRRPGKRGRNSPAVSPEPDNRDFSKRRRFEVNTSSTPDRRHGDRFRPMQPALVSSPGAGRGRALTTPAWKARDSPSLPRDGAPLGGEMIMGRISAGRMPKDLQDADEVRRIVLPFETTPKADQGRRSAMTVEKGNVQTLMQEVIDGQSSDEEK